MTDEDEGAEPEKKRNCKRVSFVHSGKTVSCVHDSKRVSCVSDSKKVSCVYKYCGIVDNAKVWSQTTSDEKGKVSMLFCPQKQIGLLYLKYFHACAQFKCAVDWVGIQFEGEAENGRHSHAVQSDYGVHSLPFETLKR